MTIAIGPGLRATAVAPGGERTDASTARATVDGYGGVGPASSSPNGWSEAVAALLATYGFADRLAYSRPTERILTAMAKVDALIRSAGADLAALRETMVARDARRTVFLMEGLLEVYTKIDLSEFGRLLEKNPEVREALDDALDELKSGNGQERALVDVLRPMLKAATKGDDDALDAAKDEGKERLEQLEKEGVDLRPLITTKLRELLDRRGLSDGEASAAVAALVVMPSITSLEEITELENELGDAVLHPGLVKTAASIPAPPEVMALLEADRAAQDQKLRDVLEKNWLLDDQGRAPAFARLLEALSASSMQPYDADRRMLLRELGKMVEDVGEEEYDLTEPELGIHELRRDLREIAVLAEAVGGLVQLDREDNPIPELRSALDKTITNNGVQEKLSESKFVRMEPSAREPGAVSVSLSLYTVLMEAILEIGYVKDKYEPLALIAEKYVEAGLFETAEEARKMLDQVLLPEESEADFYAAAAAFYTRMMELGFFETFADQFKAAAKADPSPLS